MKRVHKDKLADGSVCVNFDSLHQDPADRSADPPFIRGSTADMLSTIQENRGFKADPE